MLRAQEQLRQASKQAMQRPEPVQVLVLQLQLQLQSTGVVDEHLHATDSTK
jgi:hypothetical protein